VEHFQLFSQQTSFFIHPTVNHHIKLAVEPANSVLTHKYLVIPKQHINCTHRYDCLQRFDTVTLLYG